MSQIREYEICMKNGIRRELLPLVKLRGIGRVRARRLFNNNITSPDAVLAAGIESVTRIIGRGIAEQIFAQLEGKKTADPEKPERDAQREHGLQMRIIMTDNQHSLISGDRMPPPPVVSDIRAARCTIRDLTAFLQDLRAIAADHDTHIICFNADMIAGRVHAASAVARAVRAFEEGRTYLKHP